jgi:hypothetical protein
MSNDGCAKMKGSLRKEEREGSQVCRDKPGTGRILRVLRYDCYLNKRRTPAVVGIQRAVPVNILRVKLVFGVWYRKKQDPYKKEQGACAGKKWHDISVFTKKM